MSDKEWEKSPQELVDRFYQAMKAFPQAELRKMFGYPCAFLHGNMVVGLHESNLAVRLPPAEREEALKKGHGVIFAPMAGRVMKEYVALEANLIADPKRLLEFVAKSIHYGETLPPKTKPAKKQTKK